MSASWPRFSSRKTTGPMVWQRLGFNRRQCRVFPRYATSSDLPAPPGVPNSEAA